MPRGLVLPFPAPGGLTRSDHRALRRVAALLRGARVEGFTSRNRRVATVSVAERQFWVERTDGALRVRDGAGGAVLAEGTTTGGLIAALRGALLPGRTAARCRRIGSQGRSPPPCQPTKPPGRRTPKRVPSSGPAVPSRAGRAADPPAEQKPLPSLWPSAAQVRQGP